MTTGRSCLLRVADSLYEVERPMPAACRGPPFECAIADVPRELELFELDEPIPEKRERYWEFERMPDEKGRRK